MNTQNKKFLLIILGAGSSSRFGDDDKIFINLLDKPVFLHSIDFFQKNYNPKKILFILNEKNYKTINKFNLEKNIKILKGGKTRGESVFLGLENLKKDFKENEKVLIHNACNPNLDKTEIDKLLSEKNAIIARKINGTIKLVKNDFIENTLRDDFYCAETPQMSSLKNLYNAYKNNFDAFDESDALLKIGIKTKIIKSRTSNFKITFLDDINEIEKFMKKSQKSLKIGIGEDSHKFSSKKTNDLILGMVKIKNSKFSFLANSDGDVIIHSICRAILSALSKNSFSKIADKIVSNGKTDSSLFLKKIIKLYDFSIINISISIECKTPKIDLIENKIKEKISKLLSIKKNQIGITAHSGENLTDAGKGKGVFCKTVVLLETII